jgi:hypothetical protein
LVELRREEAGEEEMEREEVEGIGIAPSCIVTEITSHSPEATE